MKIAFATAAWLHALRVTLLCMLALTLVGCSHEMGRPESHYVQYISVDGEAWASCPCNQIGQAGARIC